MNDKKDHKLLMGISLTAFALAILVVVTLSQTTNQKIQAENFQRVGNTSHVTFMHLTSKQVQALQKDTRIKDYGLEQVVFQLSDKPFDKQPLEIVHCDTQVVKWRTAKLSEGTLPTENTNEAVLDTAALKCLGLTPRQGEKFRLALNGKQETFTLSGWWQIGKNTRCSQLLLPQSRAEKLGKNSFWNMEAMLSNTLFINHEVKKILQTHNYQGGDEHKKITSKHELIRAINDKNTGPFLVLIN